jgi:gamma-glutamyltranspeptidase / glutathione hydrolase
MVIAKSGVVRFTAVSVAILVLSAFSCSREQPAGPGDVVAETAMVASAHPAASAAGLEILKKGGNAVDAAVAAAFALSIAEPHASGIGGGGFMIIKTADMPDAIMIDYRESAPRLATPEYYYDPERDFDARTSRGPDGVGIPGLVAGAALALENYGTMSLAEVLEPAIRLAREGIPVSTNLQAVIVDEIEKLMAFPATEAVFLPDGLPPEPGDILKNEDLAATLEKIAAEGPTAFYDGEIAIAMAAEFAALGAWLDLDDLKAYQARLRRPVSGSYRGFEIVSAAPPSGGGTHLIQILNILEGFDIAAMEPGSARYLHILAEAMKPAFADKAAHSGDPDFHAFPIDVLTNKAYAEAVRRGIREGEARFDHRSLESIGLESENTSHLSVVDGRGNAVALTQSINSFFGSGVVVSGTGILLNNHMADFDAQPGGTNAISPGRRPASSIAPTLVFKDGHPYLVLGSPGALRIISALAQIIVNIVDFGMGMDEAIEAPRIHAAGRTLSVEGRIAEDVIETLRSWGHTIRVYPDFDAYFGGAQGIRIDPKSRKLHGGADSRRDGVAAGY